MNYLSVTLLTILLLAPFSLTAFENDADSINRDKPVEEKKCKSISGVTGLKECPPYEKVDRALSLNLTTGMMYHKYTDPIFNKDHLSDNVPFIGAGVTLTYGPHWFGEAFYQFSDKGKDGYFLGNTNTDVVFARDEWILTGGFRASIPRPYECSNKECWPEWLKWLKWLEWPELIINLHNKFRPTVSLFGGYKWSDTNIAANFITLPNQLYRQEVDFATNGPFLGVGLSIKPFGMESQTRLSFTFAYTSLTGDYNAFVVRGETENRGDSRVSDAKGWRYGAYWSGPLRLFGGHKLTYKIAIDYYDYDMNLEETRPGDTFFVKERIGSINASLNWVFDIPSYGSP